jgi:hypothetical protein
MEHNGAAVLPCVLYGGFELGAVCLASAFHFSKFLALPASGGNGVLLGLKSEAALTLALGAYSEVNGVFHWFRGLVLQIYKASTNIQALYKYFLRLFLIECQGVKGGNNSAKII